LERRYAEIRAARNFCESRYRAADAVTVVAASEVLQTTIETGGENLLAEHNKGRRSGRRACACELSDAEPSYLRVSESTP
jgi:hypothetical protein